MGSDNNAPMVWTNTSFALPPQKAGNLSLKDLKVLSHLFSHIRSSSISSPKYSSKPFTSQVPCRWSLHEWILPLGPTGQWEKYLMTCSWPPHLHNSSGHPWVSWMVTIDRSWLLILAGLSACSVHRLCIFAQKRWFRWQQSVPYFLPQHLVGPFKGRILHLICSCAFFFKDHCWYLPKFPFKVIIGEKK